MGARRKRGLAFAPAGSLEAVRAAVANGADAVYLGAARYNARDEGAQLSLDEVEEACRIAHARQRRIYLTLNILLKYQSDIAKATNYSIGTVSPSSSSPMRRLKKGALPGVPGRNAPSGARERSNCARVTGGQPRSRPMRVMASA